MTKMFWRGKFQGKKLISSAYVVRLDNRLGYIKINATLATIMPDIEHSLKNYIYIWFLYYSLMDYACSAKSTKGTDAANY